MEKLIIDNEILIFENNKIINENKNIKDKIIKLKSTIYLNEMLIKLYKKENRILKQKLK